MTSRFTLWLSGSMVLALVALSLMGWGVTALMTSPPREQFRTSYFSFDLAPGWWCETDGTETICRHGRPASKSVIAVIAMKQRNEQDNLAAYEAHLKKPQPAAGKGDDPAKVSQVRYVERRLLGGHEWVDSLHAGSEIPGFLTYYLATATSHIGILVTVSVREDEAERYKREIDAMMGTLSVNQR